MMHVAPETHSPIVYLYPLPLVSLDGTPAKRALLLGRETCLNHDNRLLF